MEIVFATGNENKVKEVKALLPDTIQILSLTDIGFEEDIPETRNTIEGNAKQKAETIYHQGHEFVFAEDTGLEVEALNGEPGVNSARYAGNQKDDDANIRKLLQALEEKTNQSARFKTVIALYLKDKLHCFEGILNGIIISDKRGNFGFGYDPVFIPHGYDKTLAELSFEEKNSISHRAKAMQKLINFLSAQ